MYTTLIDIQSLAEQIDNPSWVIVDCRFQLDDTEFGRRAYQEGHIPGAVYAHLDEVLSNPPTTDNGRHPLPPPNILVERFSLLGIDESRQVVAYDDNNGMIAARLWWLLRYMGHSAVAVLDGGWGAWQAAGLTLKTGVEGNKPARFSGRPRTEWLVRATEVHDSTLLVDSRSADRYRGEEELIDPVAGRIPGAIHHFYQWNWTEADLYLPAEEIHRQLVTIMGDTPGEEVTFYCGSGVSACVNLLAMVHAGLGNGRLYAGSWSDWITDPQRAIETG